PDDSPHHQRQRPFEKAAPIRFCIVHFHVSTLLTDRFHIYSANRSKTQPRIQVNSRQRVESPMVKRRSFCHTITPGIAGSACLCPSTYTTHDSPYLFPEFAPTGVHQPSPPAWIAVESSNVACPPAEPKSS